MSEEAIRYEKEKLELVKENETLRQKLEIALQKIAELSVKKNSKNSSLPPSHDIEKAKRNSSLRTKSGKKSGGQPGHKGSNLQMVKTPDVKVDLVPNYCNNCGKKLETEKMSLSSKRQVIDLPKIEAKVTEYHQYAGKCSCGCVQKGNYPFGVNANIQYGFMIESLICYLSVSQYIPYNRIKTLLADFFNLDISEGTIDNLLNKIAKKGAKTHETIREEIESSNQSVGSDETSVRVNGKNKWVWVWQTAEYTYIRVSPTRGKTTIDEIFPNGFKNAVLVSDRWVPQLKTIAKSHQLCLAHLLRDLNYLIELEKHAFSEKLKSLFLQAYDIKRKKIAIQFDSQLSIEIESELNKLLSLNLDSKKYPKTATIQNSLMRHRDSIFQFLYDKNIPPDNNASERAIRNVKVKQKISGQFKSGEDTFTLIRSIIDTCKKKGLNILEQLIILAQCAYN